MKQADRRHHYYAGRKSLLDRAAAAGDLASADHVRVQLEAVAIATGWREFQDLSEHAAVVVSRLHSEDRPQVQLATRDRSP